MTMNKYHDVNKVLFREDAMVLTVDGKKYLFPLSAISKRPRSASRHERENLEIYPSGYGIHWTMLDEDLSIAGLLGIKHQPHSGRAQATA